MRLFLAVVVFTVAIVAIVDLVSENQYQFSTAIQIGTVGSEQEIRGIIPPEVVATSVEQLYIPMVLRRYELESGTEDEFDMMVNLPRASSFLFLTSEGPAGQEEIYRLLQQRVADKLIEDHRRLTAGTRIDAETELAAAEIALGNLQKGLAHEAQYRELESQLSAAKADLQVLSDPVMFGTEKQSLENSRKKAVQELASLKDKHRLLKGDLDRLNKLDELLQGQLAEQRLQIETSAARRDKALQEVTDEARAMTLLMIEDEIQKNRDRAARLEERLFILGDKERARLAQELSENERGQLFQQDVIALAEQRLQRHVTENAINRERIAARIPELEAKLLSLAAENERAVANQTLKVKQLRERLVNFPETRLAMPPTRSIRPTGLPLFVKLPLALVLGLVLGILVVFLREFTLRVRSEVQAQGMAKVL